MTRRSRKSYQMPKKYFKNNSRRILNKYKPSKYYPPRRRIVLV